MTHEDFVREVWAALRAEDLPSTWASTFSTGLHRQMPAVSHAVMIWDPRLGRYSSEDGATDDEIREGLKAFAEQMAGPRPDDLIGKGM